MSWALIPNGQNSGIFSQLHLALTFQSPEVVLPSEFKYFVSITAWLEQDHKLEHECMSLKVEIERVEPLKFFKLGSSDFLTFVEVT